MFRRCRKDHFGPPIFRYVYNRVYKKTGLIPDDAVRDITSRLSATTTWGVLIAVALGTAGVDTSPLLTGLGVGGAALGFAAKDIGANFMAGVLLALDEGPQLGDRLRVGLGANSAEGIVTGWDLRHLTLLNDKGERVLIPNSMVFSSVITVGIGKNAQPAVAVETKPSIPSHTVRPVKVDAMPLAHTGGVPADPPVAVLTTAAELLEVFREVDQFGSLVLESRSAPIIHSRPELFPIKKAGHVTLAVSSEAFARTMSYVRSNVAANGTWVPFSAMWDELPDDLRRIGHASLLTTIQRDPSYEVQAATSAEMAQWIRGNAPEDIVAFRGSEERVRQPDFLAYIPNHWVPMDTFQTLGLPGQCRTRPLLGSYSRLAASGDVVFAAFGRRHIMRRTTPTALLPIATRKWTTRMNKYALPRSYVVGLAVALPRIPTLLSNIGLFIEAHKGLHATASTIEWSVLETVRLFPSLFAVTESLGDVRVHSLVSNVSLEPSLEPCDVDEEIKSRGTEILAERFPTTSISCQVLIDYSFPFVTVSPK